MLTSLTAIHFLISYACPSECDHCFIWGAPGRRGMTRKQVDTFLQELRAVPTITAVCAEGGEAFGDWDLALHMIRRATELGLSASALTNAFWVTSREAATARIVQLKAAGLTSLGVSTDEWHQRYIPVEKVDTVLAACADQGLSASRMETQIGGVMFRGRAAERLASRVPPRAPEDMTSCPHEQLGSPSRVHLDCYGKLHLCQGVVMGVGSPSAAIASYDPQNHPIIAPLLAGGPFALARYAMTLGFELEQGYADACHLCYRVREFLRPRFPDLLGPDEMYGA